MELQTPTGLFQPKLVETGNCKNLKRLQVSFFCFVLLVFDALASELNCQSFPAVYYPLIQNLVNGQSSKQILPHLQEMPYLWVLFSKSRVMIITN